GDAALSSPDSLVIVVGHPPAQLAHTSNTVPVTSIATTVPGNFGQLLNRKGLPYMPANAGIESSSIDLILSVVALAMLARVLFSLAAAPRLPPARREQRFAAMRLVGATGK